MKIIEKSLSIAIRAYAGKLDKAGSEYIKHPLRIMAKMKTDAEMSVALLHDVIEDSDGKGSVKLEGKNLSGGEHDPEKDPANTYYNGSTKYYWTGDGQDLIVNDGLVINKFSNGTNTVVISHVKITNIKSNEVEKITAITQIKSKSIVVF